MKTTTTFILATALVGSMGSQAELLVYEPFDYGDAGLNGQSGALGTSGAWASTDGGNSAGWQVHPQGQLTGVAVNPGYDPAFPDTPGILNVFDGTVANLQTSGGFAGMTGPEDRVTPLPFGNDSGTGNMDASIGLAPSVTASFTSGSTTWFSFVSAHAWDRNQGAPQFMIGTDTTTASSRGLTLVNAGSGIGGGGGPPRFNLQDTYPQYFSGGINHITPGGYQDGVFGGHNGIVTAFVSTTNGNGTLDEIGQPRTQTMPWIPTNPDGSFGAPNIIVGKIQWDADTGGEDIITVVGFLQTDTLSESAFDALVAAEPALSSANWVSNKPSLDQTQFDTLNFSSLKFFVDEIRLATTFDEAVPVVPEPSSLAMIGLGLLSLLGYRRRQ